jgi:hypothetical protein
MSYHRATPCDIQGTLVAFQCPGGINLDQDTGEMTTAWTLDAATAALQALYGPADRRVLGSARAAQPNVCPIISATGPVAGGEDRANTRRV